MGEKRRREKGRMWGREGGDRECREERGEVTGVGLGNKKKNVFDFKFCSVLLIILGALSHKLILIQEILGAT